MKSIGMELERLKVIVNNTYNKKPSSCWNGRISAKIPLQMGRRSSHATLTLKVLRPDSPEFMVMKFDTNKL
jgi:hypothetical protein